MNKYRNIPTVVDGIRFASKKEAARWTQLCLLQKAGQISDLQRQVRIPCIVNGYKVCTYVADFQYVENGKKVVEDVKSAATITQAFRIKRNLMLALFGVKIWET